MIKILELPALRANRRRNPILKGLILLGIVWAVSSGCSIKRTVKIALPSNALQDKTATFNELLNIVRNYDNINSLSSNDLRVTLSTGKRESGEIQEYRSAPGYIVLRKPDSIRLVLQVPVTKTAILDLLSVGDDFCAWIPRENKYFTGKNSAKELIAEDLPNSPGFTMRATHIFEAIIPQSIKLDTPGIHIASNEETNADARYYVLSVYKEGAGPVIHALRKIWIKRSGLTIARQQVYGEDDKIVSDITYSNEMPVNGLSLPLKIHIDRPVDGYALDMEFKSWRVNPDLPDNAFVLTPPPGAQIVPFKEKGRSAAS
jgi:hypothetical protein